MIKVVTELCQRNPQLRKVTPERARVIKLLTQTEGCVPTSERFSINQSSHFYLLPLCHINGSVDPVINVVVAKRDKDFCNGRPFNEHSSIKTA